MRERVMRFRATDDIVARIRASLTRKDHSGDRGSFHDRKGMIIMPHEPADPIRIEEVSGGLPPVVGRRAEMNHPDDRASVEEWGHADTGSKDGRP
jgi:hypothetical protein